MEYITKKIEIILPADRLFALFIDEFNEWWPKAYTWSQDRLEDIFITPKVNGFCTEIGPNNFRIDWGTVTAFEKGKQLSFRWQIGPTRDPIPNVDKASLVTLKFEQLSDSKTQLHLKHTEFQNHGKNYSEYRKALDSSDGWDHILNCFQEFVLEEGDGNNN